MSGAGNLFSVMMIEDLPSDIDMPELARAICNIEFNNDNNNNNDEHNPFKSEGIIVIAPAKNENTDFDVQFYNPDGSSGMMCGNGGRVAVRFALDKAYKANHHKFSMAGNLYEYELHEDKIKLFFSPPSQFSPNIDIEINENLVFIGDFVNTGTNHYIINYDDFTEELGDDFRKFDINKIAPDIRNHSEFAPVGTNVNFFQIDGNTVRLRTYEKGVEAETGACGTGAIATAISLLWKKDLPPPITIIPPSGEALIVDFKFNGLLLNKVTLEGPATYI